MKISLLLAILGTLSGAAALELKNDRLAVELDPQGAAIRALSSQGVSMTAPNTLSGTDKLLENRGNVQRIEEFGGVRFQLNRSGKEFAEFSAPGRAAMEGITLTKRYELDNAAPALNIDYTLENRSDTPRNIAFWSRYFPVRRSEMRQVHSIFMPRQDGIAHYTQPGNAPVEAISLEPPFAALAVRNDSDGHGLLFLPPRDLTGAFYAWFSKRDDSFTTEHFLRTIAIAPHGKRSFRIRLVCFDAMPDLKSEAFKSAATGEMPLTALQLGGKTTGVRMETPLPAAPKAETHLDAVFARQYLPAVRAVRLPAGTDAQKISVTGASGPVPFALKTLPGGELQVLIPVAGLNPEGYYHTKIENGVAYDRRRKNAVLGPVNFNCRIETNAAAGTPPDAALADLKPELVYNGNFAKTASYGDWPDGYFWSYSAQARNHVGRVTLPDGARAMKLTRPDQNYTNFPVFFRVEPGVEYTASAKLKSENPGGNFVVARVEFFDAADKLLSSNTINLLSNKETFDWRTVRKNFFAPKEATAARLVFAVYGVEQAMYVTDVSIVPSDLLFQPKSERELLREQLKSGFYKPLDLLETISHATVTPHEPWFKPAAPLPELLYLPVIVDSNEDATRRTIVELAQRMDLRYRYIPLLRRITGMRGPHFGVHYPVVYANELEPYTMHCLQKETALPKVVLIQRLDFATVQPEFAGLLGDWRARGASLLLLDCANIPAGLLGERIAAPAGVFSYPVMRTLPPAARDQLLAVYRSAGANAGLTAVMRMNRSDYYLDLSSFDGVPAELASQTAPDYYGREYPYWEYLYLPLLKTVRFLAGDNAPAVVTDASGNALSINARSAFRGELALEFRSESRRTEGATRVPLALNAGGNTVPLALPALPGGVHIGHYRVLDAQNQVCDAGAFRFETPETVQIGAPVFAAPDRVLATGAPAAFRFPLSPVPANGTVTCEIEDSDGRIIARQTRPAAAENTFTLAMPTVGTTLNRVLIRVASGAQPLARREAEFSVLRDTDPHEMRGIMWISRKEMYGMLRDEGFDMFVVPFSNSVAKSGLFRALRSLNAEPVPIGSGTVVYKNFNVYKGNKPTDPVRNPCFSDPALQQQHRAALLATAGSEFRYFNITNHLLSDESDLGSTVCLSPHCLNAFRAELQQKYSSLAELNRAWGSSFLSWDAVTPSQLAALPSPENLAPWLEHKEFMTRVFAKQWLGNTVQILNEIRSGSRAGLSGTQEPGYSYNWPEVMKHVKFLCYYDGIQTKLIHDFAQPGFSGGQWGGGYTDAQQPNEAFNQNLTWYNLLLGANLAAHWHGGAVNGDVAPTENLNFFTSALREIKRGLGKLYLEAKPVTPQIAMLYSQPSCFAAMGSVGQSDFLNSLNGWKALLDDLRQPFRFLSTEALAAGEPQEKVLILPCAFALSAAELESIAKFVRNGGTVIADVAPGYYAANGSRANTPVAAELFGTPGSAPRARMLETPNGLFRVPEAGGTFGEVRAVGQGRVLLLNFFLSPYRAITLGGVGGEDATVQTGPEGFCREARRIVGEELVRRGVTPQLAVTDAAGKTYPCMAVLRRDGDNYVLGIHRYSREAARFADVKPDKITVKLPFAGYIYDLRKGRFVAQGSTFELALIPGSAQFFSILATDPAAPSLNVPATVTCGKPLTLSFSAGSSAQCFHLEMRRPDGSVDRAGTRNIRVENGAGEITLDTAFNDPAGVWTAELTHVNTGRKATGKINFIQE